MKRFLIISFYILGIAGISISQPLCGIDTFYYGDTTVQFIPSENFKPGEIKMLQDFNGSYEQGISNKTNTPCNVITIPVVVHVVWHEPVENISDAQINSQIDALNEDFRKLNADFSNTIPQFIGLGADMEIEFELLPLDIDNDPSTPNGIDRTYTTVEQFKMHYGAKDIRDIKWDFYGGKNAIDPCHVLNIWVGDLDAGGVGTPPWWGDITDPLEPHQDGIAVDYAYFGTIGTVSPPYDNGYITTHEIGHWLNLFHTFEGNRFCVFDDGVTDTPRGNHDPATNSNPAISMGGCNLNYYSDCIFDLNPPLPHPPNPPTLFMEQNYMGYAVGSCMTLFTEGQKQRAWQCLLSWREKFLPACFECPADLNLDNHEVFRAYYQASNKIESSAILYGYLGSGSPSIRVDYQAGNHVHLMDGFSVFRNYKHNQFEPYGYAFHGHIGNCINDDEDEGCGVPWYGKDDLNTEYAGAETSSVSVYPNPTHGNLSIVLNFLESNVVTELRTIKGDLVYSKSQFVQSTTTDQIDMSTLPRGVYFIRTISSSFTDVQKVIHN